MMVVKKHQGVVAICDKNLLGKKLEDEKRELNVSEYFYKGDRATREEVIQIFQKEDNINIVGKEVVKVAIEEGFISEEDVTYIQGVPHVQIYNISE